MIVPMLGDDVPRETIEQVRGTARHRLRQQPQHPCAIADDAFGAYAFLAQHAQIEGTIALGQTLAGKVVDQRQMRELRYWCGCGRCGGRCLRRRDAFQRAANPQLNRRGPQQIAPTHNLGDAHIEIIDTDDELIREQPVRTPDDDIADLPPARLGEFDVELAEEFLRAFAVQARITLHVRLLRGKNLLHCVEAIFKALGRALRQALTVDPRVTGVPSTKGSIEA